MKKLRMLIADDHALVRCGARGVLHTRHGWSGLSPSTERAGESEGKARESLQLLAWCPPDVLSRNFRFQVFPEFHFDFRVILYRLGCIITAPQRVSRRRILSLLP